MIRSLRVRLMLAAATLAVLFMLGLLPAMQGAFSLALQDSIEQRLASDVTTLISAARVDNNRLLMPAQLPDPAVWHIEAESETLCRAMGAGLASILAKLALS